jgi:hypothetical protein
MSKRKVTKVTYDINPDDLVPLQQAATELKCSTKTMYRRINAGDWTEGLHWVDNAAKNAKCRKILINVKEVKNLRIVSASFR